VLPLTEPDDAWLRLDQLRGFVRDGGGIPLSWMLQRGQLGDPIPELWARCDVPLVMLLVLQELGHPALGVVKERCIDPKIAGRVLCGRKCLCRWKALRCALMAGAIRRVVPTLGLEDVPAGRR
jgi:hypothetical protein